MAFIADISAAGGTGLGQTGLGCGRWGRFHSYGRPQKASNIRILQPSLIFFLPLGPVWRKTVHQQPQHVWVVGGVAGEKILGGLVRHSHPLA